MLKRDKGIMLEAPPCQNSCRQIGQGNCRRTVPTKLAGTRIQDMALLQNFVVRHLCLLGHVKFKNKTLSTTTRNNAEAIEYLVHNLV